MNGGVNEICIKRICVNRGVGVYFYTFEKSQPLNDKIDSTPRILTLV